MQALQNGELNIAVRVADAPARIELTWSGKSNDPYSSRVLGPFFAEALAAAARDRRLLELRFHTLEHFNSSTVGALIELIQRAREATVRLVVGYDPTADWQRLSFDALRVFDRGDGLFELRATSAGEAR